MHNTRFCAAWPGGCRKICDHANSLAKTRGCWETRGSFFFKRGDPARGNGMALFATIAYQLAISVPWLRAKISQIVENDPSIVQRTIETQMIKLISEPCRSQRGDGHVTILIDGLDECERHDVQQEILHAIRIASSHSPIFLRFIVASRPEPYIREVRLMMSANISLTSLREFIASTTLWRISHCLGRRPTPCGSWSGNPLVILSMPPPSSNLLMIKIIGQRSGWQSCKTRTAQAPSRRMIHLTTLPDHPQFCSEQSDLIPILGAIVNFTVHPVEIDQILGLEHGETRLVLRGLHSLLVVPSTTTAGSPPTMHHFSISSRILAALGISVSVPCTIGLIWHESFLKLMLGLMNTALDICQDFSGTI
ncbi:hypothetical protein B0H14DRAFT_782054 [Mycena olivaceomarginata]|nr:hypothetical protein B0H14DRAFT_782054 [Mycena olivaceomarginata]